MLKTTHALVLVMIAASTVVTVPAVAHECQSYDECPATGCNEGEDHSHTDMNYFARDESCKSTSSGDPPPPPPPKCIIADKEFPREVCDLLKTYSDIPKPHKSS